MKKYRFLGSVEISRIPGIDIIPNLLHLLENGTKKKWMFRALLKEEGNRAVFDKLLQYSIKVGLERALGSASSTSFMFYIDTNIAGKDPESFSKDLEKIFDDGASAVIGQIILAIAQGFQFEGKIEDGSTSLSECIQFAKQSFLAKSVQTVAS